MEIGRASLPNIHSVTDQMTGFNFTSRNTSDRGPRGARTRSCPRKNRGWGIGPKPRYGDCQFRVAAGLDLTDGDLGVLQQFGADRTSDRKPVQGYGFGIFQHSSSPTAITRDLAERGVVVRDAVDGRGTPRTAVGFYELIISFFSCFPLRIPSFFSFLSRYTSVTHSLASSSIHQSCSPRGPQTCPLSFAIFFFLSSPCLRVLSFPHA